MTERAEPILCSIKDAATRLGVTPWSVYKLADDQRIRTVYQGRRRYVVVESLHEYVDSLPTEVA